LSQCSTLFVMRMSNDRDQEILRSAVSDAAAKLLDFVPSLGTRETFAFGEGVTLPTRLTFTMLPVNARPHNESIANWRLQKGAVDLDFITLVVERWRGNMASNKTRPEFQPSEVGLAEKLAPPKLPSSPAPAQPEKARAVPVSIRPAPTLARPLAPPERPAPTPGQPASATSATPSFASGIDPERYSILKKQILAGRDTATQPRNGTPTGPRKDTVPNP